MNKYHIVLNLTYEYNNSKYYFKIFKYSLNEKLFSYTPP